MMEKLGKTRPRFKMSGIFIDLVSPEGHVRRHRGLTHINTEMDQTGTLSLSHSEWEEPA